LGKTDIGQAMRAGKIDIAILVGVKDEMAELPQNLRQLDEIFGISRLVARKSAGVPCVP
jgi:hypothetical protein